MTCPLCKQHYPMIDRFHYDEGGFLECEDLVMTFNSEEAERQNQQQFDDAQQNEILEILKSDGPCYVCDIVRKTGLKATEVRWHLEKMKRLGDVYQNWITLKYSV